MQEDIQEVAQQAVRAKRGGKGKSIGILFLAAIFGGVVLEKIAAVKAPRHTNLAGEYVGIIFGNALFPFLASLAVFGITRAIRRDSTSPTTGLVAGIIALLIAFWVIYTANRAVG